MSAPATVGWAEANQRSLVADLARIRALLATRIARLRGEDAPPALPPRADDSPPSALDTLAGSLGLSPFERDTLLLCAGVELDGGFAHLCATAQGNPACAYPTFSLALAALPGAHWDALTPTGALRRWRLVEVGAGSALTVSPLRAAEQVVHYLTGLRELDERLLRLLDPLDPPESLAPSHQALADRIARLWARAEGGPLPHVQLCGESADHKRAIAAAACWQIGLRLHALRAERLPAAQADLDSLLGRWDRDAALLGSALLLEHDDLDSSDAERSRAAAWLAEQTSGALLLSTRERRPMRQPTLALDVHKPRPDEQRAIWRDALGAHAERLNGQIDVLVGQFNMGMGAIRSAGHELLRRLDLEAPASGLLSPPSDLPATLWDVCRLHARARLDDLAQRIDSAARWDDLVLPEGQRQILRDIAAHVRQRSRVYEQWGFAGKGARGLGISALFAGASGTGKTTAAEVLAGELRLDLYKIDLSAVVSKYIGETEKNLRRIFDAAEAGGAILLFDEADALFGKRSEVKDSHDRYANIEVSYLLQRMESYHGLAILTTNMKQALDQAFLRRIRFVVQFPFPDAAQRAEIWRRIFPPATPTEGLDMARLARLNAPGGHIRNIALNAAFLAADEGTPVRMSHLLHAARVEYAKHEKTLTDAEIEESIRRVVEALVGKFGAVLRRVESVGRQ